MVDETKVTLHVLTAGLVLDRSAFMRQNIEEMRVTVSALRASANSRKTVTVIDSAALFFTSANMLELIKAGDEAYKLIAEKAKVTLRAEDVMAIKTAEAVKKAIEVSMVPPVPPYTFTDVPDGWSVKTHLMVNKGARGWVRRVRSNPQGNGTTYSISLNQLRRIWAVAAPRWQTEKGPTQILDVRAEGYTRQGSVDGLSVEVGCQNIQRYELEQLAMHLGWDFPTPAAK